MVNYDLPWNPNRLEQRFGRIHRIGQTEVCHLWNLVATETREGEVYDTLLEKLEEEREALGGQVFDVLGKLTSERPGLRELLIEAIRYGDQPEVRARSCTQVVEDALDREHAQDAARGAGARPERADLRHGARISARRWSAPMPGGCSRTSSPRSSWKRSSCSAAQLRERESRSGTRSRHVPLRSASATG